MARTETDKCRLLVVEDEIALSTQIMPHSEYTQLKNILYPAAVISAFSASLTLLYYMQKIKMKEALGLRLNDVERRVQLTASLHQMRIKAQAKENDVAKVAEEITDPKAGPPERTASARKAFRGEAESPAPSLSDVLDAGRAMPMAKEFGLAQQLFTVSLASSWNKLRIDRKPPGCCYIMGDVEVVGSRARAKIGVLAAYQPRENKILWVTTKAGQMWDLSQRPKGGA